METNLNEEKEIDLMLSLYKKANHMGCIKISNNSAYSKFDESG